METTKLFVCNVSSPSVSTAATSRQEHSSCFLTFFPVAFAFCISELSAAATALLEDMMLANDNAGVANGPAYNRNILLPPGLHWKSGSNCNTLISVQTPKQTRYLVPWSLEFSLWPFASPVPSLRGGES